MGISLTITDAEFVTEVRTALGELDDDVIQDSVIKQQKKRWVIPYLQDKNVDGSSDAIDTAVIAMTAERSFDAWLKKRQITSGEVSIAIDIDGYQDDLAKQTEQALSRLNVSRNPGATGTAFVDSSDGWL